MAQQDYKISSPRLSFVENILTIEYNITNCSVADTFFVDIEISDSKGNIIDARNVTGDIGKGIVCGRNKFIYWDLTKDGILLDDEVTVEVIAEKLSILEPGINYYSQPTKYISRGNIIASSLILPGLGQMKATGKKSYLLIGVMAYGSAGASVASYFDYLDSYERYLEETEPDKSDRYFAESESSFARARYFMYQAIGIWTVNMVWSALVPINRDNPIAFYVEPNMANGINVGTIISF